MVSKLANHHCTYPCCLALCVRRIFVRMFAFVSLCPVYLSLSACMFVCRSGLQFCNCMTTYRRKRSQLSLPTQQGQRLGMFGSSFLRFRRKQCRHSVREIAQSCVNELQFVPKPCSHYLDLANPFPKCRVQKHTHMVSRTIPILVFR